MESKPIGTPVCPSSPVIKVSSKGKLQPPHGDRDVALCLAETRLGRPPCPCWVAFLAAAKKPNLISELERAFGHKVVNTWRRFRRRRGDLIDQWSGQEPVAECDGRADQILARILETSAAISKRAGFPTPLFLLMRRERDHSTAVSNFSGALQISCRRFMRGNTYEVAVTCGVFRRMTAAHWKAEHSNRGHLTGAVNLVLAMTALAELHWIKSQLQTQLDRAALESQTTELEVRRKLNNAFGVNDAMADRVVKILAGFSSCHVDFLAARIKSALKTICGRPAAESVSRN